MEDKSRSLPVHSNLPCLLASASLETGKVTICCRINKVTSCCRRRSLAFLNVCLVGYHCAIGYRLSCGCKDSLVYKYTHHNTETKSVSNYVRHRMVVETSMIFEKKQVPLVRCPLWSVVAVLSI
jgi:hypothetical protein